ncbi:putative beta-glucosidase M [Penicillium chrysogenum]|uniref:beta-glucosidase n=2 Tax=Penicillium chrysogenum species complex TaxID=254878 RepID=B6HMU2_PENRW|nr:putative beta-glucosidase M [Penicillium chrysogenum]CAP96229.1 Pc21g13320 [Penicillium rubens Wisconsin 54-1255]
MPQLKRLLVTAGFLINFVAGQDTVVHQDTHFYGQSPPIYPSPEISGTGGWNEFSKAQALVLQMTLEEKTSLTGGYPNETSGCGGNIPAIARLGFPGMCLQDGPNGVRAADFVNGYPSGIHVGASWNKTLAYSQSHAIGGEFRRKGATVALGPPVLGPLGRIALGGRNWETYSNDPYLTGALGAEAVKGVQDNGVISCTKHFVGNEQEMHRNPRVDPDTNTTIEASSSNIDDRTMHEHYMWPFADAVHAGTASIMCAYERLNNSYSCHNSKLLNGLLKTELGFQGFVVSDWFAQHTGIASATAGLDMVMPYGYEFWGDNLTEAVRNGSISEGHINNMATRIMAAWYFSHQDDKSLPPVGVGLTANFEDRRAPTIDARDPNDAGLLMEGAIQGHVLVKNVKNSLPLKAPRMLSIYGYDAKLPDKSFSSGGYNGWALGLQSQNYRSIVCGFGPIGGQCPAFEPIAINGTMIGGGGSGAVTPVYMSSPFDALEKRARREGTQLFWDFNTENATSNINSNSDACLVFLNAASSEGVDRPSVRDSFSDSLVKNIAADCDNTIVTIHNAGVRLVDEWIEHPNVTAVIFAHLPGQDSGEAITKILYGDVSPSGKLPYSVPRNESDYGPVYAPVTHSGWDRYFPQDDFKEGVFTDYRAFDREGIDPRFEFGFGLTYTTFEYSNLKIENTVDSSTLTSYPMGPIIPGGHSDLWDTIATVTADVTNTGSVEAAEIAQLYVGIPMQDQPIRQLRGFDKVTVPPEETRTVEFKLRRRDLSTWDVHGQNWRLLVGSDYPVYVGASSRNLKLSANLSL